MIELVPAALYGWIVAGAVLFWLLRPRTAALVVAVGGYLFLPTAMFDARWDTGIVNGQFSLPYWIMPAALPSEFWLTKATVVGLSLLVGMAFRDPTGILQVRWKWVDLLMALWCLWPLVPGVARGFAAGDMAAMTAYQTLAWGMPYLAGRVYFSDAQGMEALADAFLIGGLVNVPICLLEWLTGPIVYGWVYGFHPYARDGVQRYLFNRPLGFFELGNQSGAYLAAVAMLGVWLAAHGRKRRVMGIPLRTVAIVLVAEALLAQGVGAILIAAGVLALLFLMQSVQKIWPAVALAVVVGVPMVGLGGLVLTHRDYVESKLMHLWIVEKIFGSLDELGRHSLAWRLKEDAIHLPAAMRHTLTGNGDWDWWQTDDAGAKAARDRAAAGLPDEFVMNNPRVRGTETVGLRDRARPWDLPMLVLGMYGVVGLLIWAGVMVMPVVLAWGAVEPKFWRIAPTAGAVGMSGVIVVLFLDSFMNSPLFLPVLLASGGLVHVRLSTVRGDVMDSGMVTRIVGTVAYGAATLACVPAAWRVRGPERRWWAGLLALTLTLTVDLQFNWRFVLAGVFSDIAMRGHWYADRRPVQVGFDAGCTLGWLAVGLVLLWLTRRWGWPLRLGMLGGILAVQLLLLEVISLHQIDAVMYFEVGGVMVVGIGWVVASAMMVAGAVARTSETRIEGSS